MARWEHMRRPSPTELRRRWVALALAAIVVVVVALAVLRPGDDDPEPAAVPPTAASTPVTTAPELPGATTTTLVTTGRFLRDEGGPGEVVGHEDSIRTYRVEVEDGAGVPVGDFVAEVDRILSDPRGWTTADGIGLQRVSDPDDAELIITLATPDLVDVLCFPLVTEGHVSCAKEGQAVINAERWHQGAPPSGLGLEDYRAYLISHEVGHLLGHDHEECPGPGELAPVMLQQTLGIGECSPNSWPAPDDRTG